MALGAYQNPTISSGLGNIQAAVGTPNAGASPMPGLGGFGMGSVTPGQPLASMNGAPAPGIGNIGNANLGAGGGAASNMGSVPVPAAPNAPQQNNFAAQAAQLHPQAIQALKSMPPGVLQHLHGIGMIHPQLMQHLNGQAR
jgi:hypothetical protein